MNGRKHHIVTDVPGLITGVVVRSAAVQDRDGAKPLPKRVCDRIARLKLIPADGIYNGDIAGRLKKLFKEVPEAIQRPGGSKGFTLLEKNFLRIRSRLPNWPERKFWQS